MDVLYLTSEELGAMKGQKATTELASDAKPRYHKAQTVPYAYQQKVKEELDQLVAVGILEPIESSDWAAPIVPVIKSDKKSVRICGSVATFESQSILFPD